MVLDKCPHEDSEFVMKGSGRMRVMRHIKENGGNQLATHSG
jgi:hypothetical protein